MCLLCFITGSFSTKLTAEQSRTELSKQLDFTMPCCYCYFRYCSCNCSRGARLNPFLGNSNYLLEYFAQDLYGCYLLSSDTELSQPTSLYKELNCSVCCSTFLCYFSLPVPIFFLEELYMFIYLSSVLPLSGSIIMLLCHYYYFLIPNLLVLWL